MGLRRWGARARGLLFGGKVRDEIRDEFEFHIEQRTADNIRRGLPPDEARRAAERTFGRRTHLMEAAYAQRGGAGWLETVLFDLRHAVRRLRQMPGFTSAAVMILVLGIGVNTALFSVLSAALLSPLPVPAAGDVVRVYSGRSVAFPTYLAFAEAAGGEMDLAAYAQRPLSVRFGDRSAERVAAEIVTDNYFGMLRVATSAGHHWSGRTQRGNVVPVVLSETFARRISATTSLAGSGVWINGEPGIVVGIVPAAFTGSNPGFPASAWIPIDSLPDVRARLANRADRWLGMIGRLASPGSARRVQARLMATATDERVPRDERPRVEPARGLAVSPDSRTPFLASLGALTAVMVVVLLVASASVGGLLLARSMALVASASVGGLLLARSMAARSEMALRLALGGSRARIAQQILCETLLLALLAGIVSVLLGMSVVPALTALIPADYGLPVLEMRVTGAATLFTMAIAGVAGALFGLLPARRLWSTDIRAQLRDLAGSTPKRGRASAMLVAAQVAGSVMLLVTAGMFLHALYAATSRTPSVAGRVLVVPLALHENGYSDARAAAFTREAAARLLANPAVRSVSLAQFGLYSGSSNVRLIVPDGRQPFEVESNGVGPGYFGTIHLPLLAGRDFASDDLDSGAPVVIVNAALLRHLRLSPIEAIGTPVRTGSDRAVARIIGVVQNADNVRPGEGDRPFLYELLPRGGDDVALHVEAVADGPAVVTVARDVLRQLDPNLPLYRMRTLEEQRRVAMAPSQGAAAIATALGAVTLCLAAAGVYAMTAFLVAARTREIGIRVALGASRAQILQLASRDGLHITVAGLAAGLALAFVAARLLNAYVGIAISGIVPIGALSAAVVCGSVALAAWRPLRRSLATDPVRVLRAE